MDDRRATDLTQYLAQEIKSHSDLMLAQRTRNNLIFSVGPFVILGVVAANDAALNGLRELSAGSFGLVCAGIFLSFLGLGWIGASIEQRIWGQCNAWRTQIAELNDIAADRIVFEDRGLMPVYLAIFGIVGAVTIILLVVLYSP